MWLDFVLNFYCFLLLGLSCVWSGFIYKLIATESKEYWQHITMMHMIIFFSVSQSVDLITVGYSQLHSQKNKDKKEKKHFNFRVKEVSTELDMSRLYLSFLRRH